MEVTSYRPLDAFTSEFEKKTEDIWACPICDDTVKNPHVIDKCLHIFCKVCIDNYTNRSSDPTCPSCIDTHYVAKDIKFSYRENKALEKIWNECMKKANKENRKNCKRECIELHGKEYEKKQFLNLYRKKYKIIGLENPYTNRVKLEKNEDSESSEEKDKTPELQNIEISDGGFTGKKCIAKEIKARKDIVIEDFRADKLESLEGKITAKTCKFYPVSEILAQDDIKLDDCCAISVHSKNGTVELSNTVVQSVKAKFCLTLNKSSVDTTIELTSKLNRRRHFAVLNLENSNFKGSINVYSSEMKTGYEEYCLARSYGGTTITIAGKVVKRDPGITIGPTKTYRTNPRYVDFVVMGNGTFEGKVNFIDCEGSCEAMDKVKATFLK